MALHATPLRLTFLRDGYEVEVDVNMEPEARYQGGSAGPVRLTYTAPHISTCFPIHGCTRIIENAVLSQDLDDRLSEGVRHETGTC